MPRLISSRTFAARGVSTQFRPPILFSATFGDANIMPSEVRRSGFRRDRA